MRSLVFVLASLMALAAACGPPSGNSGIDGGSCSPGARTECYEGQPGTEGVGPCRGGTSTCDPSGQWGPCQGQTTPQAENCNDGVDNNCNGMTDEDVDLDGDGITTCDGDCCDSTECSTPAQVNQGAFDTPGDSVDNDCNGQIDDAAVDCDVGIASGTQNAGDYAKAIDLCQTASMADKKWGVIDAKLTLANGSGTPAGRAQAVRPRFGSGVTPKRGQNMALFSTGAAAGVGDTNPEYQDFQGGGANGTSSGFPADFVAANGGTLPNAPGCPGAAGSRANDPVMLTLQVRVPTNAKSFKLNVNFFSSEFPEFTCSQFNDFFVVLLDSTYAGTPANPNDKNLAFYENNGQKYPVGVNLASGNTGLFTQCVNGATGCRGNGGTINTCTGTAQLTGTGLDTPTPGECDGTALQGGGTGWLETSGNVTPGEIMTLRIAIWDTSDSALDSIAVVDGFTWNADVSDPGTVILRQ